MAPISEIVPSSSVISGLPLSIQGELLSKLKSQLSKSVKIGFSYKRPSPGSNSN
tara:strand:+ start:597 stop:758 length:162 start_codon:yes stop_codon:yes gene_type:complete